jgi:hypothetical protein
MPRIRGHRELDADATLYVLRPGMRLGDRTFQVGEKFVWQRYAGVTLRNLRMWHDQRLIGHEDPRAPAQGAEDLPVSRQERAKRAQRAQDGDTVLVAVDVPIGGDAATANALRAGGVAGVDAGVDAGPGTRTVRVMQRVHRGDRAYIDARREQVPEGAAYELPEGSWRDVQPHAVEDEEAVGSAAELDADAAILAEAAHFADAGPESQVVRFLATPGERVSVATPSFPLPPPPTPAPQQVAKGKPHRRGR